MPLSAPSRAGLSTVPSLSGIKPGAARPHTLYSAGLYDPKLRAVEAPWRAHKAMLAAQQQPLPLATARVRSRMFRCCTGVVCLLLCAAATVAGKYTSDGFMQHSHGDASKALTA